MAHIYIVHAEIGGDQRGQNLFQIVLLYASFTVTFTATVFVSGTF